MVEISIAGSAQRLQAQRDAAASVQAQRLQQDIASRASESERLAQERLRGERVSEDLERTRLQRELIRDETDRRQIEDQRIRTLDDDRLFQRNARLDADEDRALQDRLLERELNEPGAPLPPLEDLTSTAPPAAANEDTLRQLLADRDGRRSERAASDRVQALQTERDFERSQQAINALNVDPSSLPTELSRGTLVDFTT